MKLLVFATLAGVLAVNFAFASNQNTCATSAVTCASTISASSTTNTFIIPIAPQQDLVSVQVTGLTASGATISVLASTDNTNYNSVSFLTLVGSAITSASADGQYRIPTNGSRSITLNVTSAGTGTITTAYQITNAVPASSFGAISVVPSAATSTSINGTTSATALTFTSAAAANSSRKGCLVFNNSSNNEYVFFGATASATTANSILLAPQTGASCNAGSIVLSDNVAIASSAASSSYAGWVQ